ncbi:hypothetical protein [Streptomyces sp. NPDC047981]|uniref:hypothetical protein n=1 Tax=Streptomyces sp. NPDC047981 TaxID=3154610 RepID=UPI003427E2D3
MSHTTPSDDDLAPNQATWLEEFSALLPFTHEGTSFTSPEQLLPFMPEPQWVAREVREWYCRELAAFEADRNRLEQEFKNDPPNAIEMAMAQELYDWEFLPEVELWRPIDPVYLEGARDHQVVLVRPSSSLIREAARRRSADWFDDDQSDSGTGMQLDAGEVQNADKISHLFYSGVMNSIFGDRSAGKTWLALALAREFIERGEHVAWLNFEAMLGSTLRARLSAMGVDEARVATYFHAYDRPDEAPATPELFGLVVIDAVDPCLSHMGRNTHNDGSAVDEMAKRYFYPYQAVNPSVVGLTIDHIGNSNDRRESGSRRKQHYTQGVKYQMVSERKARKGTKGYAALLLRKDNSGEVPFDDGEEVAYVVLDSTRDVERIEVLITAHAPLKANESVTEQTQRKSARNDALQLIRDVGVITRAEYLAKMQALGYTGPNARKQIQRLKDVPLIEVGGEKSEDFISWISGN